MVVKNLEIWNALRRAGRDEIVMKSIIANTITKIYGQGIDIVSVKHKGEKIFIKTSSALINSELNMLTDDIQKQSLETLSKLWINISKKTVFRFI